MRKVWAWHISERKVEGGLFSLFFCLCFRYLQKKKDEKIIFKSGVHCEDDVPANFDVDRDYDWSQDHTED